MERKGVTAQHRQDRNAPPPDADRRMLLHKGEVDGMICGTWGTTAMHLATSIRSSASAPA
jgi:malate dehydrogenase (oxaloacetate-decarboxylating)(NADP+)